MQVELGLEPDDLARLSRLPLLRPLRSGRARGKADRIVWHDGSGAELARHGMVVIEQGRLWRLERLWSRDGAATPLASGPDPTLLGQSLPEPLLPMAAFEGVRRILPLVHDRGPVAMTVLCGAIRAGAAATPVARVRLEGGAEAVRALAVALAAELRIGAPPASLSAEALALGTGLPLAVPEGVPDLPPDLSVGQAFGWVLSHLCNVLVYHAGRAVLPESGTEPVHQMRVAVRRLRSAIKVFRPAMALAAVDEAGKDLKALAAKLAPARDWDVLVTETCAPVAAAFPDEPRLKLLLAAAEERRRAGHEALNAYLAGNEFRRLGIGLACVAAGLDGVANGEPAEALEAFAARKLRKLAKRLLQADNEIAGLEPTVLHAIRLRAKRLRYAAEIFAPVYAAKAARRYLRALARLQDRLGALNDAAVAASLLAELDGDGVGHAFATGLVLGFIGARGRRARERVDKEWRKFEHAAPFWE